MCYVCMTNKVSCCYRRQPSVEAGAWLATSEEWAFGGCAEDVDALGGRGCLRTPTGSCGCVGTMSSLICCIPRLPDGGCCSPRSPLQWTGSAVNLPHWPRWHTGEMLKPKVPKARKMNGWAEGVESQEDMDRKKPTPPNLCKNLGLEQEWGAFEKGVHHAPKSWLSLGQAAEPVFLVTFLYLFSFVRSFIRETTFRIFIPVSKTKRIKKKFIEYSS